MKHLAIGLCVLFAQPASSAVNIITDGSFENNPAETGGYSHFAGNTSFDGGYWHVTGTDILVVDANYRAGQSPPLVFNAQDGNNSLDLTGTGNSGPGDGVYQDITTVIGQTYILSFYAGHATTTGSDGQFYGPTATTRVSIGGGSVREFVNSATVANGIAWQNFSESFTATEAITRIAFLNGAGNEYLGLDNVAVMAASDVPELSTWAMSVAGFAAVGTILRGSRKRTSLVRHAI